MTTAHMSRRTATWRMMSAVGGAALVGRVSTAAAPQGASAASEISRVQESIHQVRTFHATRHHVYEVLTDDKQFSAVEKLSAAAKSGMIGATHSSMIAQEVGGAFSLFGGVIVGRHIELVPDVRIVQAWRSQGWPPGVFSIAAFALADAGAAGTQITLDHTGFPVGQAQHLAEGWVGNYWDPMKALLG